jgi:hypothetical protein
MSGSSPRWLRQLAGSASPSNLQETSIHRHVRLGVLPQDWDGDVRQDNGRFANSGHSKTDAKGHNRSLARGYITRESERASTYGRRSDPLQNLIFPKNIRLAANSQSVGALQLADNRARRERAVPGNDKPIDGREPVKETSHEQDLTDRHSSIDAD